MENPSSKEPLFARVTGCQLCPLLGQWGRGDYGCNHPKTTNENNENVYNLMWGHGERFGFPITCPLIEGSLIIKLKYP